MTTDTVTRKKTFLDFLEREKNSTRERMRQCQVSQNDDCLLFGRPIRWYQSDFRSTWASYPRARRTLTKSRMSGSAWNRFWSMPRRTTGHSCISSPSWARRPKRPKPHLRPWAVPGWNTYKISMLFQTQDHRRKFESSVSWESSLNNLEHCRKVQKTDTDDHQDDIEDLDFDPLRNDDTLSLGALGPGPGADDLLEEQLDTDDAHVAEGRGETWKKGEWNGQPFHFHLWHHVRSSLEKKVGQMKKKTFRAHICWWGCNFCVGPKQRSKQVLEPWNFQTSIPWSDCIVKVLWYPFPDKPGALPTLSSYRPMPARYEVWFWKSQYRIEDVGKGLTTS